MLCEETPNLRNQQHIIDHRIKHREINEIKIQTNEFLSRGGKIVLVGNTSYKKGSDSITKIKESLFNKTQQG